jgi:hypothetical protein
MVVIGHTHTISPKIGGVPSQLPSCLSQEQLSACSAEVFPFRESLSKETNAVDIALSIKN